MMNKVIFVVIVTFVSLNNVDAQGLPTEQVQHIMSVHQQCRQISHVPESVIMSTLMGNFNYDPQLATHLRCMAERIGVLNNGKLNRELIGQMLTAVIEDEKEINELVNRCAVEQSTPELTVFKSAQCFHGKVRSAVMG